jgi:hypothetical protein
MPAVMTRTANPEKRFRAFTRKNPEYRCQQSVI